MTKIILTILVLILDLACNGGGRMEKSHNLHKVSKSNEVGKFYEGTLKPVRKKHVYKQLINAKPDVVFPLLCPEEEKNWAPGWDTTFIISDSGKAELDCVFGTNDDSMDSIWFVNVYNPEDYYLEMIKVTPGYTICRLTIKLTENENDSEKTNALISYEFTSLGKNGEKFIENFTKENYTKMMVHWEKAMNYYIKTGKMIPQ